MQHNIKYLFLLIFILPTINATDFCATSSSDLQLMLNISASNGQADHIRIHQGTYMTLSSSGFQYIAAVAENHELKITGGWAEFFGQPCGHQPSKSPFTTKLNANFISRGLNINASRFGDVVISNLLFQNGSQLNCTKY
jgi:hypothetical protein